MTRGECVLPIECILHPDYQDFVKTCRLNLDDIAPFLVWADWLEEYGVKRNLPGPQIKAIMLRYHYTPDSSIDKLALEIRALSECYCGSPYQLSYDSFLQISFGFDALYVRKPSQVNNIVWPEGFGLSGVGDMRIYGQVRLDKVVKASIGRVLAAHPYRHFYRKNMVWSFLRTDRTYFMSFKSIGSRFRDFVQEDRKECLQAPLHTMDTSFTFYNDFESFKHTRDVVFRNYLWMLADEWVAAQQKLRGIA